MSIIIIPIYNCRSIIIVIFILVTASTFLEFFEEFRSNKAAEKLKELVATTTTVLRDGKEVQIPIKEVTLGDIVVLSAGSMIPADLRIIEAVNLKSQESSLTAYKKINSKWGFLGFISFSHSKGVNLNIQSILPSHPSKILIASLFSNFK